MLLFCPAECSDAHPCVGVSMILIHVAPLSAECSDAHPCVGLSNHAHFRNFGMAFLTLFRVATGDNWNGIMKVSSTKAYFPEVHH